MQARYVKSQHVLIAVALAWTAGIVVLNMAYVWPRMVQQTSRLERDQAGAWLRLADRSLREERLELKQCAEQWAQDSHIVEALASGNLSPMIDHAAPIGPEQLLLCKADKCLLGAFGRLDRRIAVLTDPPCGTDLSSMAAFRAQGRAAVDCGLTKTPQGASLYARAEVRQAADGPVVGYVLLLRSVDAVMLSEMSSLAGATVTLVAGSDLPAEHRPVTLGVSIWHGQGSTVHAAQALRDSAGESLGVLAAQGPLDSTQAYSSTLCTALLTTLAWGGGFAVLMIVVIHTLVSHPAARLLERVQRLRAGEEGVKLATGLRGEALMLAKEFEEVLGHIEKLSQTDSLTGVSNRRSFRRAFIREFHRARRYSRPMTLAMLDLDYLKAANDVLGHQAGDEIIQIFSQIIGENIRQTDVISRLGGDEFAILMPETTEQEAAVVAERIRAGLATKSIGRGEVKITPTASIGLADLSSLGADTPDALLNVADKAMYVAKKGGRNRIVRSTQIEQLMNQMPSEQDKVDHLCKQLAGLDAKFKRLFIESIGGLISALEARDEHSANHSNKVRRYCLLLGRQLNLPQRTIEHLGRAAMLHDIGKIGLPDSVLLKTTPLTPEEWEIVKRHALISVRIMEGMEFLDQEIPAVRYHHEHYDGSGYPEGLSGSAIPLAARVMAVADAFDAMTSDRAYRGGMKVRQAVEEIKKASGTQFDPAVVEAFVKLIETHQITQETISAGTVAELMGSTAMAHVAGQ